MTDRNLAINHDQGEKLRTVGRRIDPSVQRQPSGEGIATSATFTASLVALGGGRLVRKGVYRFQSHEDADRQLQLTLAQSMAHLAMARDHG